jgi:hypothetical protein
MLEYLAMANETAQESDPSGLVGTLFIIGGFVVAAGILAYNAWKIDEIDETEDIEPLDDPLRPRIY